MASTGRQGRGNIVRAGCGATLLFIVLLVTGCNSAWFYRPNDKAYISLDTISPESPVFLKSYSGNQLQTLLIPAEVQSGNTLLVHFHGNAGNITWTSRRYDWLRKHGYDLLVFDYSGYGHSSGTPDPETTWKDALTLLDYALEQKAVQGWDRIVLAGTSLGGNILLHALAHYPRKDEFDLVLIDSSFMSYEDVAVSLVVDNPFGRIVATVARWLISDRYAPVRHAPVQLNMPVVVAHCTDDRLISVDLGRTLYEAIDSPQKQWLAMDGCDHAQGFSEQCDDHRRQLIEVLAD